MSKNVKGFTDDERAAMKARALELKSEDKANKNRIEGEKILLASISAMPEPDRSMAQKVHEIVTKTAPSLFPKTWYGMPAYTNKDGKVVCFFQAASKFKYRYSTLGFQEDAHLDNGNMWPNSYALIKLTSTEEEKIVELIKTATH